VPLLWAASVVVRTWCRTLRWEVDMATVRAAYADPRPVTMMIWHNRLFVVPWMVRHLWPGRPIHALVSASRDGANLAKFFGYLGVATVRGSSSRFGREALHELIAVQRAGGDIAVTPDGPRGPVYEMKAGALLTARRTRSRLFLAGVAFGRAWRLRSWDRFCIPRPFSRVTIRIDVMETADLPEGEAGVARVRERLMVLSGEREMKAES